MTARCPACGSARTAVFARRSGVPVNSCLLLEDETEARRFPRGDLALTRCENCAFIFNASFDVTKATYSADYEETQAFSEHFRRFLTDLVADWIGRYGLAGKRVIEIGCGKGEFLVEMLEQGVAHGVGVDPGLHPERIPDHVRDRFEPVVGFFPADYPVLDADAVVCRHTLEHIAPVGEWMRSVRRAIGDRADTVVLFELPDALRVLDEGAFWDVYYEHCSYFGAGSLARLFRATGFEVLDVRRAYDDQYLLIEARPSAVPARGVPGALEDDHSLMASAAAHYATVESTVAQHWTREIRDVAERGGTTVIWGSGSKGVAFLAALGDTAHLVDCAVDINPFKHGRFMAGSGHRIMAPKELLDVRPELVVVMNPVYVSEIKGDLEALALAPRLEAL